MLSHCKILLQKERRCTANDHPQVILFGVFRTQKSFDHALSNISMTDN